MSKDKSLFWPRMFTTCLQAAAFDRDCYCGPNDISLVEQHKRQRHLCSSYSALRQEAAGWLLACAFSGTHALVVKHVIFCSELTLPVSIYRLLPDPAGIFYCGDNFQVITRGVGWRPADVTTMVYREVQTRQQWDHHLRMQRQQHSGTTKAEDEDDEAHELRRQGSRAGRITPDGHRGGHMEQQQKPVLLRQRSHDATTITRTKCRGVGVEVGLFGSLDEVEGSAGSAQGDTSSDSSAWGGAGGGHRHHHHHLDTQLERERRSVKVLPLEVNYRTHSGILDVAALAVADVIRE